MASAVVTPIPALKSKIAELDAQIKELNKQKESLEIELNVQEKVPLYIKHVIKTLEDNLGKNKSWQTRIRTSLKNSLMSVPEFEESAENVKRDIWIYSDIISYKWKDETTCEIKDIEYVSERPDSLYKFEGTSNNWLTVYHTNNWDDIKKLDMKSIPILIGYYDGKFD